MYRSIRLNGVAAEQNLQAFELGRKVAHNPEQRGPTEAHGLTPDTMALGDLIGHRVAELTAYQNVGYADRYRRRVDQAGLVGSEAFTRAVAVNLYKLMAYKDEYEVARLYSDGRFAAERGKTLHGGRAKVWLAPPIFSPKDDQGHPRKIAFGGWMLDFGFPILAKLKGLRGTRLDLFGYSQERHIERQLITDYDASLDRLVDGISAARLPLAIQIAQLPQQIRGYGHVKEASLVQAKRVEIGLWSAWEAAKT